MRFASEDPMNEQLRRKSDNVQVAEARKASARCLQCKNCKDWDSQRAAYAAAISEHMEDLQEVENLQASWNYLSYHDPDYACLNPTS